ncbi:uncharacterized protein PgNI_04175 [Pyricularia grisea]|uniref:Uncharacterized protein n=1 Tax=Pyricularia grisea TaxID=148305 RepID=A0A6P8BEI0_PYRGI|nr:uncharacterized protein PgNI_04175 [Pyricularia grisea]TLD14238.1 hypothetical protein PgNI_04175 [Pyricularia grisea]
MPSPQHFSAPIIHLIYDSVHVRGRPSPICQGTSHSLRLVTQ